jgi:CRP/FNR family nitrogen fixation transcriptional regulator
MESLMFEAIAAASPGSSARAAPLRARLEPLPRRPAPRRVLQGSEKFQAASSTIYAQSERAEFVYQMISGVVRTVTLHRDGRRIVHGFHLPGEIFGLEHEKLHHCSAEAVRDTRLVQCPVSRLNLLFDTDNAAAQELWTSLLLSRDRTAERFMYVMHGSAFEKLAYFLIDLAWRTQSDVRIELPMSRYDIADYLGLSSETVSRTFTAFRGRGLISTKGREVRLLSDEILRLSEGLCEEGRPHWPRQ